MKEKTIKITRKGEDGYKVISVHLKDGTLHTIDEIASQTNRSRNELINILLENAAVNVEITCADTVSL